MFANLYNLIPIILNAAFETFYICAWFYFLSREFYKIFVHPLKEEINTLKTQQDILYASIKKLKDIIDIDNNSTTEKLKSRFGHIKSNLDSMYRAFGQRLDKIEDELLYKNYAYNKEETETETEDEFEDEEENELQEKGDEEQVDEEEDDEEDEEAETTKISSNNVSETNSSNCILPIQNHITFPHFNIFKKNNCNNKYAKLLSYQLCEFLGCEAGTNMTEEDVYADVLRLIKGNKKMTRMYKIKIVPKIQRLFGITENEDYEITPENLSKFLKPHFK